MALRYVKTGEFAFRVIVGEGVLVPIKGGVGDLHSIFTMNEVGAAIWGLIGAEQTAAEIVRRLCEEFDVTPERAAEDVTKFIDALREKGLIEPVEASGGAVGMP
jgi:Coenzyme PQQ synthesis protein D (PqqD)